MTPVVAPSSRVPGAGRNGDVGNAHAWTYDPVRFQRGTRWFAAFWTALNGFALLGLATVVLPTSALPDPAMAWAVGLTLAGGIAHLVAVVGLVRSRRWARDLVAYLAAAGIGTAAFGLLMVLRAGMPLGGPDLASTAAFFVWSIGAWLVAARFAFRSFATPVAAPVSVGGRSRLSVVPASTVSSAGAIDAASGAGAVAVDTVPSAGQARPRLVVVGSR